MKTVRLVLIGLLTAAVVMAILSPSLLSGVLPASLVEAAGMEDFPLLGTCIRVAARVVTALRGNAAPTLEMVTESLDENFLDELLSLLMVSALTIPVSLCLGFLLYRPLYHGALRRGILYISLNLVSVMIAWMIYKQVYVRLVIDGVIMQHIADEVAQTLVNSVTQLLSAAAIGIIVVKVALAALAVKVVIGKIVLPLIGTLVRTLLFAFLVALMMLLQADVQAWTVIVPLMLATLIVSGLSDCAFGS